jgi:hypothetical protein
MASPQICRRVARAYEGDWTTATSVPDPPALPDGLQARPATAGDELVGANLCFAGPTGGYVAQLAVRRDRRGLGLG